jgi:hypothetical protein
MSREIVEWLRDYARRCDQAATNRGFEGSDGHRPYEVEYALKFAEMIEQRFVIDSVAQLANKPSSFPPTRIHPPSALDLRRRRRAQQK